MRQVIRNGTRTNHFHITFQNIVVNVKIPTRLNI
ncbi:MAG: hypothetical protein HFG89_08430 [Dorea sp.]|nr:hypothetical protein [Dorea sp.]